MSEHDIKIKKRDVRVELVQIALLKLEKRSFEARLSLKMSWTQKKIGGSTNMGSILDNSNYWNPKITITNYFGKLITFSNLEVDNSFQSLLIFTETKFFHANFFTALNFKYYPFDTQRLSLIVQAQVDPSHVNLIYESKCSIAKGMYKVIKHNDLLLKDVYEVQPVPVTEGTAFFPGNLDGLKVSVFLKRRSSKAAIKHLFMYVMCGISISTLALDPTVFQCARVELSLLCSWIIFAANFSSFNASTDGLLNEQNKCFLMIFYLSMLTAYFNSYGHSLITVFFILPNVHHVADSKFPYVAFTILAFSVLYFLCYAFIRLFLIWRSLSIKKTQFQKRDSFHFHF